MKITDLQPLDQDIIKALASHKGIDRAIRGKDLSRALNVDLRTLQSRIESLQRQNMAIGSIDNIGYFIPLTESERARGIQKKKSMASSATSAVFGYDLAPLSWIDELLEDNA